jgi:hypothetical protein
MKGLPVVNRYLQVKNIATIALFIGLYLDNPCFYPHLDAAWLSFIFRPSELKYIHDRTRHTIKIQGQISTRLCDDVLE